MAVQTFSNQEANSSIREKLNDTIQAVLDLIQNTGEMGSSLNDVSNEMTSTKQSLEELNETVESIISNGVPSGPPVVFPEISYTGNFQKRTRFFSVPQHAFSFFPDNINVTGEGSWLEDLEIFEDENISGGLSTLEFSNLSGVVDELYLERLSNLTSLNFPELCAVGDTISLDRLTNCSQLTFPKLRVVGYEFRLSRNQSLQNLNLPNLESSDSISFNENSELISVSMPILNQVKYFHCSENQLLSSLDFSGIREISETIELYNNPSLTSITFENLEKLGQIYFVNSMDNLTSFSYGNNLKEVTGDQRFDGCSLNSSSVDHIIQTLALLDGTNGTLEFNNKSLNIENNNSFFVDPNTFEAIQKLYDRGVIVNVNRTNSVQFNLTAGSSGSSIGFEKNSFGSVTNSLISSFINSFSTNGENLAITFSGPSPVHELLNHLGFIWIDGVIHRGYFTSDGTTHTFVYEPQEGENLTPLVNGQTYSIEITNFT